MKRIIEITGQLKGLIWELNNTQLTHEVASCYDLIQDCAKELKEVGNALKTRYDIIEK